MDSNFNTALIGVSVFVLQKELKKKEKRQIWSRQWLLRRPHLGLCQNLLQELAGEDPISFKNWMRMDKASFYTLLEMVKFGITKQDTRFREAISAEHRLVITLRYLATGESQSSMAYTFRVAQCTIFKIIYETSLAIYNALKAKVLKIPKTQVEWEMIANGFWKEWQFPNCIGSIDGKHICIAPPPGSSSDYFNYKGQSSIVLMAMVDYSYRFTYADVGTNGPISDGGVWGKSTLKKSIECNFLNIPNPRCLPYSYYVAVADEAFGLKPYIMRPYPGSNLTKEERVFNYRLSRARRIVENSFGILSNRWRFLLTKIPSLPDRVEILVLVAVCLHNFLIEGNQSRAIYLTEGLMDTENENGGIIPGTWRLDHRNGTYRRPQFTGMRASIEAKKIQEILKIYFSKEGSVPWQKKSILN